MSDETRLLELFRPNRESYTVCYSVANGRDKDGKRNGNYATYHRDGKGYVRLRKDKQGNVIEKIQKPSLEVAARRHLDGLERLVLKPQLEDGSCSWGALDHDHYNAQTSQV